MIAVAFKTDWSDDPHAWDTEALLISRNRDCKLSVLGPDIEKLSRSFISNPCKRTAEKLPTVQLNMISSMVAEFASLNEIPYGHPYVRDLFNFLSGHAGKKILLWEI